MEDRKIAEQIISCHNSLRIKEAQAMADGAWICANDYKARAEELKILLHELELSEYVEDRWRPINFLVCKEGKYVHEEN